MWKGQQLLDIMFPSISFLLNLTFYRDNSDLWRLVCFGVYQFSVSRDYNFKNYHFYEKIQKRIQNLVKHLRWTFAKKIKSFQSKTNFTKNFTCRKKKKMNWRGYWKLWSCQKCPSKAYLVPCQTSIMELLFAKIINN